MVRALVYYKYSTLNLRTWFRFAVGANLLNYKIYSYNSRDKLTLGAKSGFGGKPGLGGNPLPGTSGRGGNGCPGKGPGILMWGTRGPGEKVKHYQLHNWECCLEYQTLVFHLR